MIRVNRDQFLEQGYLILCGTIPPRDLEVLRRSYEILVDRQHRIWSEEAEVLWTRFKPVDDIMQSDRDQLLPGFQGRETRYHFEEVPSELTLDNWYASWTTGRIGNGGAHS